MWWPLTSVTCSTMRLAWYLLYFLLVAKLRHIVLLRPLISGFVLSASSWSASVLWITVMLFISIACVLILGFKIISRTLKEWHRNVKDKNNDHDREGE